MIRKSIIILTFLFPFVISAQNIMTIGEVFDFGIGDEFQFQGQANNQPPNADRIKITGKYYSSNNDTLYYICFHDSYYSEVIWGGNPYLEYHFWTETDTISYTNLDSSITSYNNWISYDTAMYDYDTIIETSEDYCDSLINGYYYITNSFEPEYFSNKFGRGLGLVESYFNYPSENSMFDNVLFYYKKDGLECGIPDSTTVSVEENELINNLRIFPNPSHDFLRIENDRKIKIESISLININGQIIKTFIPKENQIDISDIPSGIYFLKISNKYGELTKKVIIE